MSNNSLCANCGTPLGGPFCVNCGQQQRDIRRFFLTLINETLEGVFKPNSRVWRTLYSLLVKPGFLTVEYLRGRRASYIQPVRLYFFSSIVFFLVLSVINFLDNNPFREFSDNTPPQLEQVDSSNTQPATLQPPQNTELENPLQNVDEQNTELPETDEQLEARLKENVNLELPLISKSTTEKLNIFIRKQAKKAERLAKEDEGVIKSVLLELIPPVIFCLLPLFALLLKLGYIGRGIYYAEHLVFAIHCHAFIFLILVCNSLIPDSFTLIQTWIGGASLLWIPLYLWLSLKNVYLQGKGLTSLKFVVLSVLYTGMLSAGILFALLIGLMTL